MPPTRKPLRVYRPSVRNDFELLVIPGAMIPFAVWGLLVLSRRLREAGDPLEWWWVPAVIGMLLVLPAWGWLKTRFARYVVLEDAILEERGLFARTSSEIRLRDIRSIGVRQSLSGRLLWVGDVAFSSSAGAGDEVVFRGVSSPLKVKEFVRGLHGESSATPQLPADGAGDRK